MSRKLSRYSKAYVISRVREFPGWTDDIEDVPADDKENGEAKANGETDDSSEKQPQPVVYVYDDYTVHHGVYPDEKVIFDDVTDEWKNFCHNELGFSIPDYFHDIIAEREAPVVETDEHSEE
ncbi:MAG: hypothetical protein ACR2RB_20875 [Gammaproteobacteria bacterium]